ncbi:uncharacterized protein DMAD_10751 [Drosophila madeirensis]|uniref:Uncharacterized protein n=1 Tax=Drosophila madeirensis TaxID=30013 RepID=A0AAU9FAW0_DROMD
MSMTSAAAANGRCQSRATDASSWAPAPLSTVPKNIRRLARSTRGVSAHAPSGCVGAGGGIVTSSYASDGRIPEQPAQDSAAVCEREPCGAGHGHLSAWPSGG